MRAIERHLCPNAKQGAAFRRPLALVLTLLALIGVLVLASCVIGPGVADAARSIASQVPAAFDRLYGQLLSLERYWPQFEGVVNQLDIDWRSLSQKAIQLVQSWGGSLLSSGGGLIGGVVSGVSTFIIGLIFSLYILLQKEKLARQGRQVLYGLLPERRADRTLEVLRLASRTFSSFLSGQCVEVVILGSLIFAAFSVFRIPYAALTAVLTAVLAFIPYVGAFSSCAIGALLTLLAEPEKTVLCIIVYQAVQFVENQFIYPHVVGGSVGLAPIWTLVAALLGGQLFGLVGIIFYLPLTAVLYQLIGQGTDRRLAAKGRDPADGGKREPERENPPREGPQA